MEARARNSILDFELIDVACITFFIRKSLVASLKALCARILFFRFVHIVFFCHLNSFSPSFSLFFLFCVCARPLSLTKAFLPPLTTRLLCLVVAIPLVLWLFMCVGVCVHGKMCRYSDKCSANIRKTVTTSRAVITWKTEIDDHCDIK